MKKLTLSFLVLGIMLMAIGFVSASHTADVTISTANWLEPNTATDFSVNVGHNGVSPNLDAIKRVIVEIPVTGYSNLVCSDVDNWVIVSQDSEHCIYDASSADYYLSSGDSQEFEVQATTPSTITSQSWPITTRDNNYQSKTWDIVPTTPTIQEVIDAATASDTITVPAGTYTEDLTIAQAITLQADGEVIINGAHTITASSVTLDGFTFVAENGDTTIILDSSSSIINNVVITDNEFDFTDVTTSVIAINLGGATPTYTVSNIEVSSNVFDGPSNMICNVFKIGGEYGSPLDVIINTFDFEDNEVNSCSNPINLQDENIDGITIDGNTFRDTDGAVYIWTQDGTSPSGTLSNFVFTDNDIDSTNTYGLAFFDTSLLSSGNASDTLGDDNFGSGILINENKFVDIPGGHGLKSLSVFATLTNPIDATDNWWGTANKDDIADSIDGNVDYTPYWYNEDGTGTDETAPTITFENAPYNSEAGEAITDISIIISDDSGIASYTIDWDDGSGAQSADGSEATSITITPDGGSITYSDIGPYTITVTAEDSIGNSVEATTTVTIYEEPDWVVELQEGWNLISIPLEAEPSDIDSVFEDIIDDIAYEGTTYTIFQYDATGGGSWSKARPLSDGTGFYGSLDYIVPGYAYWVKMERGATLYGYEKEFAPGEVPVPSIDLATGKWNLIGSYSVNDNIEFDVAFKLLDENYFEESILEFNNVDTTWTAAENIDTGHGYWLRTKVPASGESTIAYEPGSYYFERDES